MIITIIDTLKDGDSSLGSRAPIPQDSAPSAARGLDSQQLRAAGDWARAPRRRSVPGGSLQVQRHRPAACSS